MTIVFIDGFDKYLPPLTTTVSGNYSSIMQAEMAGEWNSLTNSASMFFGNPLSVTGASLVISGPSGSAVAAKTLAGNYTKAIGGFRFANSLAQSGSGIIFLDGGTQQAKISINSSGTVSVINAAGSVVATSSASVSANSTHYLEWNLTMSNSAAYQVWLDGVSIISGSGANFHGSANNYYNVAQIGVFNGTSNTTITFDDLYIDDGNGSPLLTNPIIETHFPSSDSSVHFTQALHITGYWLNTVNASNAPGANELFLRQITAPVSGTLEGVSCIPNATSSTANFKAVIYPDSGSNTPAGQALIATGVQVVGSTNAFNGIVHSTFASPPTLVAGTKYWIGFITDTSITLFESDAGTTGVKAANTYTSGAPATCPAITTGQNNWCLFGAITPSSDTNTGILTASNPSPGYLGDFNELTDSTVSDEDLFNISALSATPTTIYMVSVKGFIKDSTGGTRTIDLQISSSGTDDPGTITGQQPATTFGWMSSYWANDPHVAGAWTPTALNAALAGYKVIS